MARIAQGDPAAFRLVADRHVDRLLALATRMLRDPSEAEDAVQDCFLQLWRNAGSWQPDAAIGTWLHKITYNACVDRLRKRRPTVPIEPLDLPDNDCTAEQRLHHEDVRRRLHEALSTLPERQRHAVYLVHFQDLTGKQAADIMNVSVEALESLLSRGRRGLRARLIDEAEDLLGDMS